MTELERLPIPVLLEYLAHLQLEREQDESSEDAPHDVEGQMLKMFGDPHRG